MSLPSSERLPDDINDLPPARQRHIRRQPRAASTAERQILLDSLIKLTAPTPSFFLRALFGALAIAGAFYLNDPVILIIAIVVLPFNGPIFSLALFPITLNGKQALKSLVSLLILLMLTIGAGALSGSLQVLPAPNRLTIYRFSALYWLDLAILGVSVLLSVLVLLRQGQLPGGLGVLLSFTLLIPLAVLGFGLATGQTQLWHGAFFVSFAHLGLAYILSVLAFLILGFPPKKTIGWLLTIVALMVTFALMSISLNLSLQQVPISQLTSPTPTRLTISSPTPSAEALSTAPPTSTSTRMEITATWTLSPSPQNTPTSTPTFEPTAYWGLVDSALGAVIRESPSFDAPVVGYTNDGDRIEILGEINPTGNSRWFNVRTESGNTGWMLGSLVKTQTTTPAPDD